MEACFDLSDRVGDRLCPNSGISSRKLLETQLDMVQHITPKTDGQCERTIQTWKECLRACVIDFGKGWDRHLPFNDMFIKSLKKSAVPSLEGTADALDY
ncbi:putative reverse transcriptase domain-containing protein [Tanacetum coccineum]